MFLKDVSKSLFLTISMLGKKSVDNILKYFYYFAQKLQFVISCKLSSKEIIFHELSNTILWEKIITKTCLFKYRKFHLQKLKI